MCLNCLQNHLDEINEFEIEITDYVVNKSCQCCLSFPLSIKSVIQDLKILCLTKMKKYDKDLCRCKLIKISVFENILKKKISTKLQECMEELDEKREKLNDNSYLNRANELKNMNDLMGKLEEADHN